MANLLVLAETDGARILPATLPTITFAQEWARETGGMFDLLLLLGVAITEEAAREWLSYGAASLQITQRPEFAHPVADQIAAACVQIMRQTGAASLAGASSAFGRDVLPRVAGLLDLPMVSDVMQVQKSDSGLRCRRPVYAGQAIATVDVAGSGTVFRVRGASYGQPPRVEAQSLLTVTALGDASLPTGTAWIGKEAAEAMRPELTTARVVVAGGRPLRDAPTFERLVGGLADAFGGAVGATGGAVGAEIAPAELLIGQTGKTVAPELYIAAGISGSDQHVAGMRDSKVIVAINTDPQATMFDVADYGLVADVHEALPDLTEKLARP